MAMRLRHVLNSGKILFLVSEQADYIFMFIRFYAISVNASAVTVCELESDTRISKHDKII